MRVLRLLLIAALAVLGLGCTALEPASAVDGTLDLRDWTPSAQGLEVGGVWRFHPDVLLDPTQQPADPGTLRNVPDAWQTPVGVGTYRLVVLLPDAAPPLQLRLPGVAGAARAWVNDTPLSSVGAVALSPGDTRESRRSATLTFAPPPDNRLLLTIQVSNGAFRRGGLTTAVELTTVEQAEALLTQRHLSKGGTLAAMTLMSAAFLLLNFIRRERAARHFAGLCAVYAIREMVTESPPLLQLVWPELPLIPVLHVEYATMPLGAACAVGLVAGIAQIPANQPWIRRTTAVSLGLAVLTLVNPPAWDGVLLRINQAWVVVVLLFALGLLVRASTRRRSLARLLLLITGMASLTVVHDILATTRLLPSDLRLASPGFLLYLAGIGFLMIRQFARNMTRIEHMAGELRQAHSQLERRHRSVLRFVPVEFLEFLQRDTIEQVERGDQTDLVLTIQFSDIRSFTTITETLTPQETFTLVGDYLERVCGPVNAHGGFIDKYIGDAVMALFPDADAALRSSLDQIALLDATNAQRDKRGALPIEVGFGVHTGPVTLGTVGSSDRLDCTVLGDTVNLASRVEGLTSRYGTRLLVTADFVASLKHPEAVDLREVDRVVVKGKTEPVAIFEVVDALSDAARAARARARADFEAGRDALFAGRFAHAIAPLEAAARQDPDDRATRLLLERAAQLQARGASGPKAAIAQLTQK